MFSYVTDAGMKFRTPATNWTVYIPIHCYLNVFAQLCTLT